MDPRPVDRCRAELSFYAVLSVIMAGVESKMESLQRSRMECGGSLRTHHKKRGRPGEVRRRSSQNSIGLLEDEAGSGGVIKYKGMPEILSITGIFVAIYIS